MQCPIDRVELVITERSGVEIDYCPKCRGVWLDRGELDKIIERSADHETAPPPTRGHHSSHEHAPRKKKRGSFLDDLFDF